jgi:hypothetical protein
MGYIISIGNMGYIISIGNMGYIIPIGNMGYINIVLMGYISIYVYNSLQYGNINGI